MILLERFQTNYVLERAERGQIQRLNFEKFFFKERWPPKPKVTTYLWSMTLLITSLTEEGFVKNPPQLKFPTQP